MGASIYPISGYGGPQYDISILVWKVKKKKERTQSSHASYINKCSKISRESLPPVPWFFLMHINLHKSVIYSFNFCACILSVDRYTHLLRVYVPEVKVSFWFLALILHYPVVLLVPLIVTLP